MRIYYDKTDGVPVLGTRTVYRFDPSDDDMRPPAAVNLEVKRPGANARDLLMHQVTDPVEADAIAAERHGVVVTMDGAGAWTGYTGNPEPDGARRERLARVAADISIAGQVAVTDPLGSTPPANPGAYLDFLATRRAAWETEVRNPTFSPVLTTEIRAADTAERDWAEAQGLVVRKVNADIYTTDNDVITAVEWPP